MGLAFTFYFLPNHHTLGSTAAVNKVAFLIPYKQKTPSCSVIFRVYAENKPFQMQILNLGVKTRAMLIGNLPR